MKTREEIYSAMIGSIGEAVGFTPNAACDLAVRMQAMAAEVEALHIEAEWVLSQCFPQTATGEYLDHHAQMRAIERNPAVCAIGTIRFGVVSAAMETLPIARGTVCMTADGTRFETTEEAALAAGSLWVDVPARAIEGGARGNVNAETVRMMVPAPVGIVYCTNPAAFYGGCDAEADEALRARIVASYYHLPNGANAAYYEQTAMDCEGVASAKAVGRARGRGTVDVYITSRSGTPTEEQLAAVREKIESAREIAVDVQVLAPACRAVDIAVEIAAAEGYDFAAVRAAVEDALRAYFTGERLGEGVLTARLGSVIYGVAGVANYHLLTPTADTAGQATTLPC
ncbi:MAG: baseplate J/gp47 family protein, partial [Oscillospiraceae bacterium]|nr:baseplate J/gp47 family protein [Oscillospiraceae bacterium]